MFSLMVVDDEVLVRVGLKTMLPWETLGCRIVADAENGAEGLRLLEELQPDIVITDIKMPVMDGLEMIRRSRTAHSRSKFIILSSYDDFHLVREAMKMGAEDYLIKLELDQDSLSRVIQSVGQKILAEAEEDRQKRMDDIQLRAGRETELKAVLCKIIDQVISSPADIAEFAGKLGIQTAKGGMACCLVRIIEIVEKEKYVSREDRMLLDRQIENLIREVAEDFLPSVEFQYQDGTFVLIGFFPEHCPVPDDLSGRLEKMGRRILTTLRTYTNTRGAVGISNIHHDLSHLAEAFAEARSAAEQSFFMGLDQVILFQEVRKRHKGSDDLPIGFCIKNLQDAFEYADDERVSQSFGNIKDILNRAACTREQVYDICCRIAYKLQEIAEKRQDASLHELLDTKGLYRDITSLATLGSLMDWLSLMEQRSVKALQESTQRNMNGATIQKAKKYIQDHLSEDIKLMDLAGFLHMNHCHVSTLFKQHAGEGFSEYVARVKIEEACKLLSTGRYRIYEVADRLGYGSSYYFSKVFKKVTQITPREYVEKSTGSPKESAS